MIANVTKRQGRAILPVDGINHFLGHEIDMRAMMFACTPRWAPKLTGSACAYVCTEC